jgi:hypothetical protein
MKNSKSYIFIFILVLSLLFTISAVCSGCALIQAGQETIRETSAGEETVKETLTAEETSSETTIVESSTEDTGNSQENTDSGNGNNIDGNQSPQKYAIVASGASHDSQHYKWFLNSTNMAHELLKNNGYSDENIYYLFESSKEPDVDYEATIGNFKKVIKELQEKAMETDNIVLFLIGHGTYIGTNSYYTLNDYNLPDFEMAGMFKSIKRDKLIFVFSPCNSGGFIDDLSGENTVVISSTRKDETNSAAFIEPFLTSFDGIGDTNSDGKVSFAEAFNYASKNVKDQYIDNDWGKLTEHAQLDDNGDKISHEAPVPNKGDGQLAADTYLK